MEDFPEPSYGGEVDEWERVKRRLETPVSQRSEYQGSSRRTYPGEVSVWTRARQEETDMRRTLALRITGLVEYSICFGLADFLITGNRWLLTVSGVVYAIFQIVLIYYFYRPKG